MTLLSSVAHICVGLSLDIVAPVFGKHVHPTGHFAPIIVLSGSGIPEFVVGSAGLEESSLFRVMSMTVIMKSTRVTIKRKMANSSI
jgi:hypothetical protein